MVIITSNIGIYMLIFANESKQSRGFACRLNVTSWNFCIKFQMLTLFTFVTIIVNNYQIHLPGSQWNAVHTYIRAQNTIKSWKITFMVISLNSGTGVVRYFMCISPLRYLEWWIEKILGELLYEQLFITINCYLIF